MNDFCKCGREVYAHWIGRGDFCLGCFNDEYHNLNREDEEFEKKQEQINKNFHEKVTAQKERC